MHFNWLVCWLLAPLALSMVDSFQTPQHPYNTRLKSTQHRHSCNFSTGSAVEMATAQRTRPRGVVGTPRRAAWLLKSALRHSINAAPRTKIFLHFFTIIVGDFLFMNNNG